MGTTWSQFFPPVPTLTESNLPNQKGKIFLVTGGYSGVGLALCEILYRAEAKVYIAGRSEEKATHAIASIKKSCPDSKGDLAFLLLRLDDLASIKSSVEAYTAVESRLDVLFNNAGVSNPPRGAISPQGHDLQFATNCLGPYLFTQLLLPTLKSTAKKMSSASVRVVWTASIVVDISATSDGVDLAELLRPDTNPQRNYENTKVGNWFLARALASEAGSHGILSVVVNPGNLKTPLTRHLSPMVPFLAAPLLYPARMGALTVLWAGLSTELELTDGGKYILPWGRLHPNPRQDILRAMQRKEDDGTGPLVKFIEYCADQTLEYM
ncbi:steroid dehydrogenase [Penicillium riverlandense]|uniref:steroid dehydrogenase n=1 Tax=Penicillium riverlandense TaxID=1903569 RepID=UPI0025484D36|nr:steroid dehydrogenase [Penicillium riverlandense]KAJ5826452.1 steroid dehydrogenase [Penicillium riverlandense]